MSSISISPLAIAARPALRPARRPASLRPAPLRSAPLRSAPLRLTRRGRIVLGALVAAPLVAGLVVASVAGPVAAGPVAAGAVAGSVSFATVTVGPGESLWSIAERIAPQDDPRDVIGELERFNGLEDSAVTPGQTLAIPAHFTS